jgi:DNA-binding GntR family transcriptional regulator
MLIRQALRDQIRDLVRAQILDGTLRPGDRLSDQSLAPRFNVSRTPMREALLELTREGVVVSDVGRGFVVRPLTIREAAENYPIVASLEALALRTAPPTSRDRLDELRSLNDQLGRTRDPSRRAELDRRWHRLLVADCGNAHLLELIERLTTSLARYELAYMRSGKRASTSQTHHGKIVAALQRRDRDAAAAWLERNWTASAEAIRGWLESAPAASQ